MTRTSAVVLLCGALWACTQSTAATKHEPADSGGAKVKQTVKFNPTALKDLGVKVEAVGGASARQRLQVPGSLDYSLDKYAEVGTIVEGRIKALYVKPGEHVAKGKVLATLIVPSVAGAQAEYHSAQAAAQAGEEHERREEALLERQLTTAREAEVARSEARRTKSALAAAAARLQLLGVSTSGDIVQGAGALTLVSPIDGVVVRRNAILGKFLSPQESAFVIADPRELRASLDVYEADLTYFQVGSDVELIVDALPGTIIRGKVALVEPHLGKANRVLRALVPVANPDGTLRPGLFVRGSVELAGHEQAGRLFVPAGAVQPLGEDEVVFVEHEPGVFEVREVVVGRRTPQIIELVNGLSASERIVVDGAFLLRAEVTKQ